MQTAPGLGGLQMTAGPDAYAIIKHFESLCLVAYLCPAGVPTIGWGHTVGVGLGQKITVERAEQLLQADLKAMEATVDHKVTVPITQNQYDALVSLVFNVGTPPTLVRLLNAGKTEDASAEFDKWVHAGAKVLPGLVKRRAAERALFDGKDYRKWLT
jgi:lysozyme